MKNLIYTNETYLLVTSYGDLYAYDKNRFGTRITIQNINILDLLTTSVYNTIPITLNEYVRYF